MADESTQAPPEVLAQEPEAPEAQSESSNGVWVPYSDEDFFKRFPEAKVSTSGAFWQHDERLDESEIPDMEKARQEAKCKNKEAMSSEGRWQHDKFAVMDEESVARETAAAAAGAEDGGGFPLLPLQQAAANGDFAELCGSACLRRGSGCMSEGKVMSAAGGEGADAGFVEEETEPAGASHFDMLPYDVLEKIVSFVQNNEDKLSLRKACRRTRSAPCLQPSGIVVDFANGRDALEALSLWPRDRPKMESLTIRRSRKGMASIQGFPSETMLLLRNAGRNSAAVELLRGIKHFRIQGQVATYFDKEDSSKLGGLLRSLCPLLATLTLENVRIGYMLLSRLVPLKHFRVLHERKGGEIDGTMQEVKSMFRALRSLEEVHFSSAGALVSSTLRSLEEVHNSSADALVSSTLDCVLQAPNLKHLYIGEAPLDAFPSLVASHHSSAVVHVEAFSLCSLPNWDDVSLASSVSDVKDAFDWPGTLIVDAPFSPDEVVPAAHKISDVCRAVGSGITKVILCYAGVSCSLYSNDVQLLARAIPHVSELELRDLSQGFTSCMLKCMLEAWSIQLLTLRASHLSFVSHLRDMMSKEESFQTSLRVKVVSDSFPQHQVLEFAL